ncbi:MAG TPA: hypothetical protein VEC99_06840, partial [Clostridia bacterium]|nr:hypothetical protein [Clostridia bacterium]
MSESVGDDSLSISVSERDKRSDATRVGIVLGVLAVVFWSFGSSLVYLGAKEAGTWPFVALGSLLGGGIQMAFRRIHTGELKSALWLPWQLWV